MASLLQRLTSPSPTMAPPTAAQTWRNDLAITASLIFALFLGIGIRNRAFFADQRIELGDNLPVIMAPAGWLTKMADTGILQVRNPNSPSLFKTEIDVIAQPVAGENADLERARLDWSLQRSRDLEKYRELDVQPVEVRPTIGRARLKAISGALTTYAYIADPSLEQGANDLPVVVQAQDVLFVHNNQLYAVTLAADASQWDAEQKNFNIVLDGLDVDVIERTIEAVPAQSPANEGDVSASAGVTTTEQSEAAKESK